MNAALITQLVFRAIELGLPLVLTVLERDVGKGVEDMTNEEMAKALRNIRIYDTDELIRKGQLSDPE